MATHSSILARKIPRTEEPGGQQFVGCKEPQLSVHTRMGPLGDQEEVRWEEVCNTRQHCC